MSFSAELLSSRNVLQHVLVPRVIPYQMQNFTFHFVGLHEASVSRLLQSIKVRLVGSTTLWCIK